MGIESIINQILADAAAEEKTILSAAHDKANTVTKSAQASALKEREETQKEVRLRTQKIAEQKEATLRLDRAKVFLATKRKVIDEVYRLALARLNKLSKEDVVALYGHLLEKYSETGDAISFPDGFRYVEAIKTLPIVEKRKLTFSSETSKIEGGMFLFGKKSDKNLSFAAILEADREKYESDLAKELFKE